MDIDKKLQGKAGNVTLAIIIILQIVLVTYYFAFVKEAYHSDEPWSYGLANSHYMPFIATDGLYDTHDTSDCWRDGSIYADYLTVNDGEQFDYASVWYNQSVDMHPPFYFLILNTICSFFPNVFSKWFAYVINIAAMILSQIFMFKGASRYFKSRFVGIAACCFWGFSMAFLDVNTFLRMYSMLTMFSIMLIYYHIRIYNNDGSDRGNHIKLAAVTFLGALTHHYFLVLAFAIAACFCFYYLFSRKFMKLVSYAVTMAGAVFLSIGVFPATLTHLFFSQYNEARLMSNIPFVNSFRFCISLVLGSLTGFTVSMWSSGLYVYFVAAAIFLIVLAVPLCFLFRNEEWFKKFTANIIGKIKYFFTHFDFMLLFIFITVVFTLSVVSISANVTEMAEYTDRYLFVMMPWAVFLLMGAAKYLVAVIKPIRKHTNSIVAVMVCISIVLCHLLGSPRYMFPRYIRGEGGIETTVSDHSSHIMFLRDAWTLVFYADLLMGCDESFVTNDSRYKEYDDVLVDVKEENDCYISIDTSRFMFASGFQTAVTDTDEAVYNGVEFEMNDLTLFDELYTEDDIVEHLETVVFPGKKLQFYSSEMRGGAMLHTYKLVPEEEYIDIPVIDAMKEIKEMQSANP